MKTMLFKPFERWPEGALLTVGLVAAVLGLLLGTFFQTRFDGVLDLHFAPHVTMGVVATDLVVDFASLFLFLLIAAKWINRKTRAVDVLSSVLVAKIPVYALTVFNASNGMSLLGEQLTEQTLQHKSLSIDPLLVVLLIIFIVLMLLLFVWSMALLWNGYRVSANAKGGKAILLFIAAVLLAEIVSKIVLWQLQPSLTIN